MDIGIEECRKYGCLSEAREDREGFCGWGCRDNFHSDPVNEAYESCKERNCSDCGKTIRDVRITKGSYHNCGCKYGEIGPFDRIYQTLRTEALEKEITSKDTLIEQTRLAFHEVSSLCRDLIKGNTKSFQDLENFSKSTVRRIYGKDAEEKWDKLRSKK